MVSLFDHLAYFHMHYADTDRAWLTHSSIINCFCSSF